MVSSFLNVSVYLTCSFSIPFMLAIEEHISRILSMEKCGVV